MPIWPAVMAICGAERTFNFCIKYRDAPGAPRSRGKFYCKPEIPKTL